MNPEFNRNLFNLIEFDFRICRLKLLLFILFFFNLMHKFRLNQSMDPDGAIWNHITK